MSVLARITLLGLLLAGFACSNPAFAPVVLAADHPAAAGDDHGHGDASSPEVPGLMPAGDLVLWSIVTFGIFLAVLWGFAWEPLRTGLDQREAAIRKSISDAEASRTQAAAMLKDYESRLASAQEQVKEMLAEARRDADHTKAEIVAAAQKEAESLRERATGEITRAKDQALAELFDFVSNNVVAASQQVIGRSLSGDDQSRLVKEALSQLNNQRN